MKFKMNTNPKKAPVFHVKTGLRAGVEEWQEDEAWIAANWDKVENFFNKFQARFGTNV